jgi:hypothetical protein
MKTIQILEDADAVNWATDWCRPLAFVSMSGGHSDYYSFESAYTGRPCNNAQWVRVNIIFGACWDGQAVHELNKLSRYEFARGDIPKSHRLRHGHKPLRAADDDET